MDPETIITPTNNGPLHVRGRFRVVLPSGRELETDGETWLCRCGASRDKPFCDGSHRRVGFAAAEARPAAVSQAGAEAELDAAEQEDDRFQSVGAADDVGEGELVGCEVDGEPIVVGRVDGCLYAIGGLCSHGQARLAEGELEGGLVVCPRHGGAFDIRSGAPARAPVRTPLPRYAVKVEGGQVLVSRQPLAEPREAR